jgi:hypothetical protein
VPSSPSPPFDGLGAATTAGADESGSQEGSTGSVFGGGLDRLATARVSDSDDDEKNQVAQQWDNP